jgi:hypothetical protein
LTSTNFKQPEVLIQATNIIIYRLPQSIIEPYVLNKVEMTEVERALREDSGPDGEEIRIPDGTVMLKEIPQEVLDPFLLSDEEVAGLATPGDVKGYFMAPSLNATGLSDNHQSLIRRTDLARLGVHYISEGI